MVTYRVQTSLQGKSLLPRDQFVNSMHVTYPLVPGVPALEGICSTMEAFYNTLGPHLSPQINQGGHTTKCYQIGAPLESPPVASRTWNLSVPTGGTPLPNEVAACFSYHGLPQPGVERASWRGRIYLGPLNNSTMQTGSTAATTATIAQQFQDDVMTAAQYLEGGLNAGDGQWVIYSKRQNKVYPVANYSMDNEWDTVRSRGLRATHITRVDIAGTIPPASAP